VADVEQAGRRGSEASAAGDGHDRKKNRPWL
jgi:hypothetical protein